jgi:hypothetical protein
MGERKLVLKVFLGFAAGVLSVGIILALNRSGFYIAWAPIIAAALIGAVTGVAEKSPGKIILGVALGCMGWICGELVSRLLFHSVATWIFVGGFIGLAGGIIEKSPKSVIGGIFLGVIGGFVGLLAGFSTIAVDALANADMQAMSILGAGVCINLMLGLKRPKNAATEVVSSDENDTPASKSEK